MGRRGGRPFATGLIGSLTLRYCNRAYRFR